MGGESLPADEIVSSGASTTFGQLAVERAESLPKHLRHSLSGRVDSNNTTWNYLNKQICN